MQPSTLPFHIVIGFGFLLYAVLLGIRRRREGIRHKFRQIAIALVAYLLTASLLNKNVQPPIVMVSIAALVGFAVAQLVTKSRSRYIPRAERRKAIAEYERKTGQKFNPKRDELDHDIAFARLGSNTSDNLRVRSRVENRRKGKKRVWWDVIGN